MKWSCRFAPPTYLWAVLQPAHSNNYVIINTEFFHGSTQFTLLLQHKVCKIDLGTALMELGLERQYDPFLRREHYEPIYNNRRFQHTVLFGKTGVGKSTALERWAIDDILNGENVIFFDFHGTSVDTILQHIPEATVFSPSDFPTAYNPIHNSADSLLDTFHTVWAHSWGPQLEQILYNAIRAIQDYDGTLFQLKYFLTSKKFRERVIKQSKDPVIKSYWEHDFSELMPDREQRERTLSTLNKIGQLISDPVIRQCIGQKQTKLKDITKRVLLIKLPQGQLGIDKSRLIASFLLSDIHHTLLQGNSKPVHIFIDECQHLDNRTLREMLSGIRKFNASLTIATQYTTLLSKETYEAIIGNVGTMIAFRLGITDAEKLQPLFRIDETHTINDDVPLPFVPPYHAYVRMNGHRHYLYMPETSAPLLGQEKAILHRSRQLSAHREHIEADLRRFIEGA